MLALEMASLNTILGFGAKVEHPDPLAYGDGSDTGREEP